MYTSDKLTLKLRKCGLVVQYKQSDHSDRSVILQCPQIEALLYIDNFLNLLLECSYLNSIDECKVLL